MSSRNKTPSKSFNLSNIVRSNNRNCDSPFKRLPSVSTPPSRIMKILNPFEQHLVDQLHLPTFSSPSAFMLSTPKNDQFKWNIEQISSLKPADIDEESISQHVSTHDSITESLVQEKIDNFFKEEKIVPSPWTVDKINPVLIGRSDEIKTAVDVNTQTLLSLPPVLPKHVEDILAPFFQQEDHDDDSILHRKLFDYTGEQNSRGSSPPLSTGLSPINFSPDFNRAVNDTVEIPELENCTLSPIGRTSLSRSACRLNFSSYMSVDASLIVPDVNKTLNCTAVEQITPLLEPLVEHTQTDLSSWDIEFKQVVLMSPETIPVLLDSSNSNTPHSKLFTSHQRKRLSDSFKNEVLETDIEMKEENVPKRLRNNTESGYQTDATGDNSFVASTPTKTRILF